MASSGIVEIQMPQMGESVTEGTVLEWHKHEGEFVEEGETVVEVSTDKVDAEVPAPASGTITKILKGQDETIEVGAVLAELDPSAAPSGDGASAEAPAKETDDTAEGGDAGASGEAAVQASKPAAPVAPEPAASAGKAEEGGGVVPEAFGGVIPGVECGVAGLVPPLPPPQWVVSPCPFMDKRSESKKSLLLANDLDRLREMWSRRPPARC